MLKNKLCLLFSLSILISGFIVTSTRANVASFAAQTAGAQSITVSALSSALSYLDQSDKKNAIAQVKIAITNLRKISTLPKYQVKGMTARLNKAISAIKKNNFTIAKDEINHVYSELAF